MKNVILLALAVIFFSCTGTGNNKSASSATPVKPKDFERVFPPTMMTDSKERVDFMLTHFWDYFNFKDTMYVHAPEITEQAFVDFISLFQYTSPDKIKESVTKLMKAAEKDSVMFSYFIRESERYLYEPNSPLRNDEYFIFFLEHTVNSSAMDDTHKIRLRLILDLAYKNRPGNKAENLQYTLRNGTQENLYDIKSKYLLLMFYNPGCGECRNTMEMIQKSVEIAPLVKNGTIKVVAVYPDENIDAWKEHYSEVPENWINGYDKSLSLREKQVYDIKAIPTLYFLDKDKKVIFKDCSVANINEFIKGKP